MMNGGRTPEELETLMEDAFVLRDGEALALLFEEDGLLLAGIDLVARGREEIARTAGLVWDRAGYVAGLGRVFQNHDVALLVGGGAINVATRSRDRSWRLAISVLGVPAVPPGVEEQATGSQGWERGCEARKERVV